MNGYLHLPSGKVYEGTWAVCIPEENIEKDIVFYTGMYGYEDAFTNANYKDKILLFTYPLIGNYGINEKLFKGEKPQIAGVVVYEAFKEPFHYEAAYSLHDYLEKWDIPLLTHVDTRAVVKKIRCQKSTHATLSTMKENVQRSAALYA